MLAVRAKQLRAIVDAYGLPSTQRPRFIDRIIEFIVLDTAEIANDAELTPDSTYAERLWGLAWQPRDAALMVRNCVMRPYRLHRPRQTRTR